MCLCFSFHLMHCSPIRGSGRPPFPWPFTLARGWLYRKDTPFLYSVWKPFVTSPPSIRHFSSPLYDYEASSYRSWTFNTQGCNISTSVANHNYFSCKEVLIIKCFVDCKLRRNGHRIGLSFFDVAVTLSRDNNQHLAFASTAGVWTALISS